VGVVREVRIDLCWIGNETQGGRPDDDVLWT